MSKEDLWGGLDLGLERAFLCVTNDVGKIVIENDCNAEWEAVLSSLESIDLRNVKAIGVEAGSGSHLVRKLRAAGLPLLVLETRQASKILCVRRHKTDTNDARGLADIVRLALHVVSTVHEKSGESRRIRTQLTLRSQIIKQRLAGENFIQSIMKEFWLNVVRSKSAVVFANNVRKCLDELQEIEKVNLKNEIVHFLELCEGMRNYQQRMDRELEILARSHPACRRFLDVPGIGPIAALFFYTAIDDPSRFRRSEDVASFLGLTPQIRESGKCAERPRISKMGNAMTRGHLAIAASVLLCNCKAGSTLKSQATALRERIGFRKARIAVARKISIILLSIRKSGAEFQAFPECATLAAADRVTSEVTP